MLSNNLKITALAIMLSVGAFTGNTGLNGFVGSMITSNVLGTDVDWDINR